MGADNLRFAVILLIPLIWIGRVHYHNWMNPVTALVVPMAACLAALTIWAPGVPFGTQALLVLVGSLALFVAGAVCIKVPRPPAAINVKLNDRAGTRWLSRYGSVAIGVAALLCGRFAARIFNASGGRVRAGVFDRATAYNNIAGTSQGTFIRLVTAFLILAGVGLLLFFASKDRRRWVALPMYWLGFYEFTVGTRGRESMFLTMLYCAVLGAFLLAPSPFSGQRSRRQILVGAVSFTLAVLALVVVYDRVAQARYGESRGAARDLVYSVAAGPSAMSYALEHPGSVSALGSSHSGKSIAGILDVVSNRDRKLGNQSSVSIAPHGERYGFVNIYSGIYILILDIGIPSTLAIMFALGLGSALVYRRLLTRPSAGWLCAYGAILLFLAAMPNTIVSQYNFWWLIFLVAPLASRFFTVELIARPTIEGPATGADDLGERRGALGQMLRHRSYHGVADPRGTSR